MEVRGGRCKGTEADTGGMEEGAGEVGGERTRVGQKEDGQLDIARHVG